MTSAQRPVGARAIRDDGADGADDALHEELFRSTSAAPRQRMGWWRLLDELEARSCATNQAITANVHTGIEKSARDQPVLEGQPPSSGGWNTSATTSNATPYCMFRREDGSRRGAAEGAVSCACPLELTDRGDMFELRPGALEHWARSRCSGGAAANATSCSTVEMSSGQRMNPRYSR